MHYCFLSRNFWETNILQLEALEASTLVTCFCRRFFHVKTIFISALPGACLAQHTAVSKPPPTKMKKKKTSSKLANCVHLVSSLLLRLSVTNWLRRRGIGVCLFSIHGPRIYIYIQYFRKLTFYTRCHKKKKKIAHSYYAV